MAVRSRRLFGPVLHGVAAGVQTRYEVPAGRTLRLSAVTLYLGGGAARLCSVGITPPGGGGAVWAETLPGGASRNILAGVCLNPGDILYTYCDVAAALYVAGFGSLLEGAPA